MGDHKDDDRMKASRSVTMPARGAREGSAGQRHRTSGTVRRGDDGYVRFVLMALGILLIVGAAIGIAYPLWWNHRSAVGGSKLLQNPGFTTTSLAGPGATAAPGATAGPGTTEPASCIDSLPSPSSSSQKLAGVIEAPAIHMKAPVLQGLGDSVLNIAVGHDPLSPWPGETGESLIEAHDVSYFSNIGALKKGQEIIWQDACKEEIFKVVRGEVTAPGASISPPSGNHGLVLVTCYPSDALFWTSQRYAVLTTLVSSGLAATKPVVNAVIPHLVVPAPPALVARGLTLNENDPPVALGTLTLSGSPSSGWREGPAGLDLEATALEAYFGAQKTIAAGDRKWWSDLTDPGVRMPSAWSNGAALNVYENITGSAVNFVKLQSGFVTMILAPHHGQLLISSVALP